MNRAPAQKNLSLTAYATRLRRALLKGNDIDKLLSLHQQHQQTLSDLAPRVSRLPLTSAERFAWKFMREVNILRPDFKGKQPPCPSRGIFHNLEGLVQTVRDIWFPKMESLPQAIWLKHFSTRKLAHFHSQKDEVAFSLVFDSLQTPRKILHYLVFHELLHRQVGIKKLGGRNYAHTSEFKKQEQQYPDYAQMDQFLTHYLHS